MVYVVKVQIPFRTRIITEIVVNFGHHVQPSKFPDGPCFGSLQKINTCQGRYPSPDNLNEIWITGWKWVQILFEDFFSNHHRSRVNLEMRFNRVNFWKCLVSEVCKKSWWLITNVWELVCARLNHNVKTGSNPVRGLLSLSNLFKVTQGCFYLRQLDWVFLLATLKMGSLC